MTWLLICLRCLVQTHLERAAWNQHETLAMRIHENRRAVGAYRRYGWFSISASERAHQRQCHAEAASEMPGQHGEHRDAVGANHRLGAEGSSTDTSTSVEARATRKPTKS